MLMAKAIWLQSSDDESITIEIATESVPIDLENSYVYWELRQTLNGEALITKTTYGAEYLPEDVSPEIVVDVPASTITVFLGEYETTDLYGEYIQYLYVRNKVNNKKTSVMYGTVGFLENPDTQYPTITYTSPELVAKQLRMTTSDGSNLIFTEDTDPPRSIVIEYIRQSETRIDRETRNSWKENYVTNEMHDLGFPLAGLPLRDVVVSLHKANIMEWDPDKGDILEVLEINSWHPYTNMPLAVQGGTWWIDYNIGQLHFNDMWPWFFSGANKVKVSYRWGQVSDEVPTDIQEAATKMVAIRLLQSEFNKIMLYNRQSNPINWSDVTKEWETDIKEILAARRRKILSVVTR